MSSHIESDMDICLKKIGRFAGQELLEELQELSYQVLSSKTKPCSPTWSDSDTIPHFRFGFLLAVPNMVPYADILNFFLMAQVFGWEGGCLWDESWFQNLFGTSKYFKLFTCTVTIPDQLYLIAFCSTLFWPFDNSPHFQCFTPPESDFTREKDRKNRNPSQCPFLLPETNRNRSMEPLDEWRHVERGLVSSQRRAWSLAKPSEAPRELEMRAFSQDLGICIVCIPIYILD